MTVIEQGCIGIWIDEIVPCLKDTVSGDIKETVVFKIESRTYLKKFQKSNGWHINWNEIPKNVEVYALALKDDNTIQGLVGVAIAADKSIEWGYEGAIHGFAANEELLRHYMDVFHAEYLGMLHQYQFFIDEEQAKNLLEVYHYEWNET